MTPDQKIMAIWGGGIAAALITGWIILDVQDSTLTGKKDMARDLHAKYVDYYPDQGIPILEATNRWKDLSKKQIAALDEVEVTLMPPLPAVYLNTDLTSAQRQQKDDQSHLANRASREGVTLPGTMPLSGTLDVHEHVRGLQLVQLLLLRQSLDACMDVGIKSFSAIKEAIPTCDPSGSYALFTIDVTMEAGFDTANALLLNMAQVQNHKGFGIRGLSLDDKKSVNLSFKVTFSLLTKNDPVWNLRFDATQNASGTSQVDPTKNNRFNSH